MRFTLIFFLLVSANLYAQNCSPEALQHERTAQSQGEYKGAALIAKLQSLMKEIHYLVHTPFELAQKKAMNHCLSVKETFFADLIQNPGSQVQDNAAFQEVLSDFQDMRKDSRTALYHLDRALEINPKSLPLLQKSLELYAKVEGFQIIELSGKPVAIEHAHRVLEELALRAEKIVEHPNAGRSLVIDALSYQALVARIQKNFPKEMSILEKILTLDPKNKSALERRFNYFISKNNPNKAAEVMKKLSREKLDSMANWRSLLILLSQSQQWEAFMTWSKKAPGSLSTDPEIQSRLARAYLEINQKDQAEAIMKKLPSKLSKGAAKIAAENQARLIEFEADAFRSQGRLSEALEAYKKALVASPRPLTVKEKISLLIYEYRKSQNFSPSTGTTKDLEEVVALLDKSARQTELKSNLFAIYLHSLQLLKKPVQLKMACLRYKELYPELLRSKDYLPYCQ